MKALRWVLALQLLFFAAWGGSLLTSHRIAETVWLETEPVDPRDLLSGHYVALRYALSESAHRLCTFEPKDDSARAVYLRLKRDSPVMTMDGPVQISRAVECRTDAPPQANGTWIAGARAAGPGRSRITFGIERYYVAEDSPLRTATSGDVVAKIAINDAHEPRVIDLTLRLRPTAPGA